MKTRPVEEQIAAFRIYAAKNGPESWARRWLGWEKHRAFSQYSLYSINGTSMVDNMIRFECINEDLETLSEKLGLPEKLSIEGFTAKTGHRAQSSRRYPSYYDSKTRDLVRDICSWEIDHFGYDFEGVKTPHYKPDPERHAVKDKYLAKVSKT